MDKPYVRDPNYTTMVFKVDVRSIGGNPFSIDTPFGQPVAVGIGDAFEEIEFLIEGDAEDGEEESASA